MAAEHGSYDKEVIQQISEQAGWTEALVLKALAEGSTPEELLALAAAMRDQNLGPAVDVATEPDTTPRRRRRSHPVITAPRHDDYDDESFPDAHPRW